MPTDEERVKGKDRETDQADEPETNAQYLSGNIQLDQQEDQQKDQQQQQIQGEQVEIQARNGEDERSMTFQTLSIKTKIQSFFCLKKAVPSGGCGNIST